MAMTSAQRILSHGPLQQDSWSNARALAMTAQEFAGRVAGSGAGKLPRRAEHMVRRLIMLMAAAMDIGFAARRKRSALPPLRRLPALKLSPDLLDAVDDALAAMRGHLGSKPPAFRWRIPDRAARKTSGATPPPTDAPSTDRQTIDYNRRLAALFNALDHPERYARKAALALARTQPEKPKRLDYFQRARLWDNAFIAVMVQARRDYPPEPIDSS